MREPYIVKNPAEGVRVVSCRTDRFKTGQLSIQMVMPLEGDVSAASVLPYLLSRSCAAYPVPVELNRKLAELYGAELYASVSKHGENMVLRLSMTMIDSRFALQGEDIIYDCADLLCKVVFEPNVKDGAFLASEVEREKRIRLERLESAKNDKRGWSAHRLLQEMCKDEAYSIDVMGTKEGVEAITPESLYATWQDVLSRARIQLNIIGTGDADKISDLVLSYLEKIGRPALMEMHTEIREKAEGDVNRVEEEEPVKQGKLVMGFRAGTKDPLADYAAIRMMTDIFGGGTYSRLFMNVREKQSLCYYCSARYLSQKGIIMVQSGIENENVEKVITEVQKQLQDLADGNVTDEDIANSKRSLGNGMHSVSDTPDDLDGWAYLQTCEETFRDPEQVDETLQKITKEQIVEAAKNVTLDTIYFLKGTLPADDEDGEEADA